MRLQVRLVRGGPRELLDYHKAKINHKYDDDGGVHRG